MRPCRRWWQAAWGRTLPYVKVFEADGAMYKWLLFNRFSGQGYSDAGGRVGAAVGFALSMTRAVNRRRFALHRV
jgi:hypothetical protein